MKRKISQRKIHSTRHGFTMIELSITLAFIGVLLIAISIIVTNIVTIYQKGLAIKAVNSVGRGLIDEFTTGINTAPSVDTTSLCNSLAYMDEFSIAACKDDHAYKYIYQAKVNQNTGEQYSGVFCTGSYSYIWNTHYAFADTSIDHKFYLTYLDTSGNTVTTPAPRLMRVEDRNYRVCSALMATDHSYTSILASDPGYHNIDITTLPNSSISNPVPTPTEGMLDEFDLDLMLYELVIFPISQDAVTLRAFMSGTFILATERGDVDIMRSGDYCSLGSDYGTSALNNLGAEFNYCAINKFNFAARTAGV